MKREGSDKTRFCVSHDGLSNGLETFCLPCFIFKNKTKNLFFEPRGSNILEPRLQYIGAHQTFVIQNRLVCLKYFFAITQMRFNKTQSIWIGFIQLKKGFSMSHKIMFRSVVVKGLQNNGVRAPMYWSPLNICLPKYLLERCKCGKSESSQIIRLFFKCIFSFSDNSLSPIMETGNWCRCMELENQRHQDPKWWAFGFAKMECGLQYIGA